MTREGKNPSGRHLELCLKLYDYALYKFTIDIDIDIIHRVRKKGTSSVLGITSSNTDRF